MFLITGIKFGKPLSQEEPISCKNCGNFKQVILTSQSYYHVFWIPFFPLWQRSESTCSHCKFKTSIKRDFIPKLAFRFRYFFGVILIAHAAIILSYE